MGPRFRVDDNINTVLKSLDSRFRGNDKLCFAVLYILIEGSHGDIRHGFRLV